MKNNKFWQNKKPQDYTTEEWESICTHCGKCCLIKLQDEENDEVFYTNVICKYFNCEKHLCSEYSQRCTLVPECLKLNPQNINQIPWIPETCAYYILAQTGSLPAWHPLVSGKPLPTEFKIPQNTISENLVSEEELEDHILEDYDNE